MTLITERKTGKPDSETDGVPLAVDMHSRADAAVRGYCLELLDRMQFCEAGILANSDFECLHDYRVALRRSRALLGQMKGIFPERDTRRYLQSLRQLGELTGPLRDHHVMFGELSDCEAVLPESLRPALAPIRAHIEQASDCAHRLLADALGRASYRRSIERWQSFVKRPAPKRPSAPHALAPVGKLCGRRIWKRYRRILRDGARLSAESPPEAFHELRKQGKKLRYLLEFFATFHAAGKVRGLVAQLKKLQDILGEYQDAAVQQAYLIRLGEALRQEGQPLDTLLAIGVLVGHMAQRQMRCRQAFKTGYDAFARKSTQRQFRRLFAPEPDEHRKKAPLETASSGQG